MAEQRVLIIGHSFVHRLKAFVQKKRHMQAFSSLSGIADIYFHGVGCRTIAKFRKFDFHVVRQLVPDVIILELGSNDLVELSPRTVGSELESLVNALCPGDVIIHLLDAVSRVHLQLCRLYHMLSCIFNALLWHVLYSPGGYCLLH